MSHKQSTPLEIVELYIRHTSNDGDPDWIPRLCANPIRRHDPNSLTEMTHVEQMDRIRGLITDMWNSPYVQGAWG